MQKPTLERIVLEWDVDNAIRRCATTAKFVHIILISLTLLSQKTHILPAIIQFGKHKRVEIKPYVEKYSNWH